MQVILLERVERLGNLGEEVTVKPGFARNYLLPQGKALRATADNIAYFEKERKAIEAANDKKRAEAEKDAKKIDGLTVDLIRQASEGGQLYGSVAARDISEAIRDNTELRVTRGQVDLNINLKTIGLFPVPVILHPEVKVEVTVNIARTADEAETQRKTGKAVIAEEAQAEETLEEAAIAAVAEEETVDAAESEAEETASEETKTDAA
jgi:large subunit ribosomal protein L9